MDELQGICEFLKIISKIVWVRGCVWCPFIHMYVLQGRGTLHDFRDIIKVGLQQVLRLSGGKPEKERALLQGHQGRKRETNLHFRPTMRQASFCFCNLDYLLVWQEIRQRK